MKRAALILALALLVSGTAMAENSSESASQNTFPIVFESTYSWLDAVWVVPFTLTHPVYLTADVLSAPCSHDSIGEGYEEYQRSKAILDLYSDSSSDRITRWEYGSTHQVLLTPGSYYFRFSIDGSCRWCAYWSETGGYCGTCSTTCWCEYPDDYPGYGGEDCPWRPVRFVATALAFAGLDVEIVPKSINPRSHGVIPVALLGSEILGLDQVAISTLRFGPDEASPAHDLTNAWTYNEHLEDVNLDGFMDLMMHFRTQDTGIACGDTEATLTGSLLDGVSFEGTDSLVTVGCESSSRQRLWLNERERLIRTDGRVTKPKLEDPDGQE